MPSALEDGSLTTGEKLLLMKGSKMYDGHPFWPWDKDPAAADFEGEIFEDSYSFQMSSLQADILAGWHRQEISIEAWSESLYGEPDLVQDVTNDCSIVASLCVATARATKVGSTDANVFSRILFPFKAPSPNGMYVVKLQFNGCWRKVVIDDRLPASRNDQVMHVTARDNSNVVWPALVEKALLKVMGGYDFPGSDSATDLWTLAGWIPERISLSNSSMGPEELWRRVSTTFHYGDVMITLGTPKLSMLEENIYGLASGHDYAIIDMKQENETRKLLIKNPWSRASDHLQAARKPNSVGLDVIVESDEDEDGDADKDGVLRTPLPPTGSTELPGTRWVDLHEVFRRYETIYLSWNPAIFPHRRDVHFTYDLSERAAAGAFTHSPQYSLTSRFDCTLWMLLCRHIGPTQNRNSRRHAGYIALYAYRSERQILLGDQSVRRTPYFNSENVLLRLDIEANTPYVVVAAESDVPGTAANFTLTAFSTRPLDHFRRTSSKYAHRSAAEGGWSVANAGGSPASPLHHLNPQYVLTVPEARSKTAADVGLLLSTPQAELPVNVKVVRAGGRRIRSGPVPARDVYASSGEYRRGAALAEIAAMQPGTYTVVCSAFDTGRRAPFTLHLYSTDAAVALRPAPADDAGMFRHAFEPVVFEQGVDRVLCPLTVAHTCRLRVKAQRVAAASSSGKKAGSAASSTASPLRIALEYGQGPDKQVLAGSGEPRSDAAALALDEVPVQARWFAPPPAGPGVWLVVERVGGAFVARDEPVFVEVLCSAAGLAAGHWGREAELTVEQHLQQLELQGGG